jgi:hypothetical protein
MRTALSITTALVIALAATPAANANHRVLATGDSMIQYVDHALGDLLAPAHLKVRSDAHVGTGLSKPFLINWNRHAKRIAAAYKPLASVVFIGANEGNTMRFHHEQVPCCSREWATAYASRVRRMMQALERDGHANVYWLTLPAPRPHKWRQIYRRVNEGIEIAAGQEQERDHPVHLVDIRPIFTPTGHFQSTISRHGRRITVRQDDGIHLNPRGAKIAARVVTRAMRRDGLLH